MAIERVSAKLWNTIDVIDLYDMGIRRSGATYLNLIYQQIPEVIAKVIGYERPLNDAWIFSEYRPEGGGFFLVPQAYWNYGIAGVVILAVILGWIFVSLERLFRRMPPLFLYGYFSLLLFLIGALWGEIQALIRGIEIALLVTGMGWIIMQGVRPASHSSRHSVSV
jgi:hypothetical protein